MNIQEAREEIIRTVRAYTAKKEDGSYAIPSLRQRPLLLIGPPGIGKTAVMEQAARECQVGFVSYSMTHHTRQSALGLPYIERRSFHGEEYTVTEYTMSEIIASVYRCMEETGVQNGLLFLDEINCVSETLAPAMLQFLQNKTFGSHRLPDGWVLAAAGNPPEYNKSVHEFDIATLDRLKYITIEADYDAWRSYALGETVHGAILAYLDTHPGRFYILRQTYASRTFATARGWEDLSCILKEYEALDFPVDKSLVQQYLQDEELAEDFALFYHLYRAKEQHLPVAQMLDGDAQALTACQTLLQENSYEENLYLVHLMLSCINERLDAWRTTCRQKERFSDTLDRLMRFQKQDHKGSSQSTQSHAHDAESQTQSHVHPPDTNNHEQALSQETQEIINAFLAKERGVLKVRREHGLSTDSELEEMRQALLAIQRMGYQLRERNLCDTGIDSTEKTDIRFESILRQTGEEELQKMEHHCEAIAEEIIRMLKYSMEAFHPVLSETIAAESASLPPSAGNASDFYSKKSDFAESDAALVLFLTSLRQNPAAEAFFKQNPENPCAPYWGHLDFTTRENALKEMLSH